MISELKFNSFQRLDINLVYQFIIKSQFNGEVPFVTRFQ